MGKCGVHRYRTAISLYKSGRGIADSTSTTRPIISSDPIAMKTGQTPIKVYIFALFALLAKVASRANASSLPELASRQANVMTCFSGASCTGTTFPISANTLSPLCKSFKIHQAGKLCTSCTATQCPAHKAGDCVDSGGPGLIQRCWRSCECARKVCVIHDTYADVGIH